METAFTPGPWIVDRSILKSKGYKHDIVQILCASPKMVCNHTIAHIEDYREIPQQECFRDANANLIAAAPDLYIAVYAFLDSLDYYLQHKEVEGTFDVAMLKAWAAVHKAEGRPPSNEEEK